MTDQHLTQRDRVLLAETIRRFIIDDIKRRGLETTYTAEALCIRATDLVYFADELLHCCNGDSVELAESVAADFADAVEEHGFGRSQDTHELIQQPGIERLDAAIDECIVREWMKP